MSGPPGPDGRHDDLGEAELEGLALLVPDDPRSLDHDRLTYFQELRDRASGRPPRRTFLQRFLAPAWLERVGVSGPLLLVVVLTVGLVGGVLAAVVGSPGLATVPIVPLASSTAAAGTVGGLTPDIELSNAIGKAPLRSLRPLVIVLIQGSCPDCKAILNSLTLQAQEYRLDFVIAGPPSQTDQLEAFERDAVGASAAVLVDKDDVLGDTYLPSGVTAILVHSDGIVGQVLHDVTADQRLEPALAQLARAGAPATAGTSG